MQNILFGLRVKPTNNFLGTDGSGDAISIYEDGMIQYDHFVFRSDVPVSSVKVRKDRIIVKEIQKVLTKYKKDIEHIPVNINNQTDDGTWYIFTFCDKTITIDNPFRYEEGDIILFSQYGATYIPPHDENENKIFLPYYNNTLLDILDEVSTILARYDLPLLGPV